MTHRDSDWPKKLIITQFQRRPTPDFADAPECHRVLAALRLPVYITTNYDGFMFKARKHARTTRTSDASVLWYSSGARAPAAFTLDRVQLPASSKMRPGTLGFHLSV